MIIVKIKSGLGNQLFQYALAYKYFREFGEDPKLNISFYDSELVSNSFRLDKFNLQYQIETNSMDFKKKAKFSNRLLRFFFYKISYYFHPPEGEIDADRLKNPIQALKSLPRSKNYLIEGWMQRTNIFEDIKSELSHLFVVKNQIAINHSLIKQIASSNSVAIHIRRGDMAQIPSFNKLGVEYYQKAINIIKGKIENPYFFVFSDEPETAKMVIPNLNNCLFISENSDRIGPYATKMDYFDFMLMRHCKHFIIANSTFSWWPAYLCDIFDSVVIAPQIWYNNSVMQDDFKKSGLLQKNWIVI